MDWRDGDAACRGIEPSLFFAEPGDEGGVQNYAKHVCAGCSVRLDCLRHAMTYPEQYGIWGGLTVNERYAWRRKHPGKLPTRQTLPPVRVGVRQGVAGVVINLQTRQRIA